MEKYLAARCVFAKPFGLSPPSPRSLCCFLTFELPSILLRVSYSGNNMCVTLMSVYLTALFQVHRMITVSSISFTFCQ
jgi:hypothetical protein